MANVRFGPIHARVYKKEIDFVNDTFRVLLVRSTSSYSPDIDHDFLDDFTGGGGVEISVASYARQTLASGAVTYNATSNKIEVDFADVAFGNLEVGQTVLAAIVYRQVGGDDTTPANDDLVCYVDTDGNTLLPRLLGGGAFNLQFNSAGLFNVNPAA